VGKTQNDEKFYENFIFTEKIGESFWSNVINCTVDYTFLSKHGQADRFSVRYIGSDDINSRTTTSVMSQRINSTNGSSRGSVSQYMSGSILLSQSSLVRRSGGESGGYSQFLSPSQLPYVSASQHAMEYTSVAEYGLHNNAYHTLPTNKSLSTTYDVDDTTVPRSTMTGGDLVTGFDDVVIALEMNDVNQQLCMGHLLRVVERMNQAFGSSWQRSATMPRWLTEICAKLANNKADSDSARSEVRNVGLFMLRMLTNEPVATIIRPWIGQIFPVLLDTSVRELCGEANISNGLNYFLLDLVDLFCSTWEAGLPTIATSLQAGKLLSFLIAVAYSDRDTSTRLLDNKRAVSKLIRHWIHPVGDDRHVSLALDLDPLSSMIQSVAAPTGGAHAKSTSKGSESVKKVNSIPFLCSSFESCMILIIKNFTVLVTANTRSLTLFFFFLPVFPSDFMHWRS